MRSNSWISYLRNVALYLFLIGDGVRAENVSPENQVMQFSYTTNGAADGAINAYGNNSVSVSGDVMRVQIGDSDGDRNINGVGIYEMKLNGKNMETAKQIVELLCSSKEAEGGMIIPIIYGVRCGGAIRHGYLSNLGRDARIKVSDLVEILTNAGVQAGHKLVKLDVSIVSIDRAVNGFLVSLKFDNSGDYPIHFKTPDRWEGKMGKYMDILAVTDSQGGVSSKIGFALAGQPLADPTQFPSGEVILGPHSAVVLKIKTSRVTRFAAGAYDLYAGAFMSIKVTGIESSLLRVDFEPIRTFVCEA
ncbi:hypothetical protein [Burkholderia lata]|uniref:hypothetical protein n=1 Tax=Burkholderia lata (strain ATCC 17760 / DSM 23089 / LMG 22485 / NCIMB 9086 / R18194 / 383) TaxID=482957 RepID=UPI0014531AD7|nr:hypothetical protein [Burkholderia lata]VWC51853.1 hypothetical protein BLA15816_08067 [Burkholderia lata]